MKSTTDLHQLIFGMSKSEKRFFKLASSIHGGNKNYLSLFDAIEKQKIYDEEKLKRSLDNEKLIKNLAYEKNYLFALILKTLRNYHSGSTIDFQLSEMIENISILYTRGLIAACEKLLHKAKKIALLHERNTALMDLLRWEWELLHATYSFEEIPLRMNNILREYQAATEKIHNLNKYKVAASTVFINTYKGIHIRGKEQQEMYKKLAAMPVLTDESKALTYDAKSYFYLIKSNLFFVRRQWENAFRTTVKLLKLLELNQAKIKEEPRKYIIVLNNILSTCNALGYDDELDFYLNKLEAFPGMLHDSQRKNIEEEVFLYANYARLENCLVSGKFEEGIKLIEKIQKRFTEITANPRHTNHGLIFRMLFSILYFSVKQYSKSIYWLNQVINYDSKAMREDIMSTAVLFNIIVHYEYGNEDIMDYLVRSAYRYLYKKNRLYKFENIMLEFIKKKLSKADTKEKMIVAFRSLRKSLLPLTKDLYENKALERFDFIAWLDSKIENKPLKEILSNKYKKIN